MAELPSMSLILTLASRNLFQDRLRFIATPDWHRFFPSSSSWCSWGFISASAAW
jgi:hypothetical protein